MNAPFTHPKTDAFPSPWWNPQRVDAQAAPILKDSRPIADWRVVVFGGDCPRRGIPLEPLEFQYYGGYSAKTVCAKARDMASAQHRHFYAVMPPATAEQLAERRREIDAEVARLAAGQRAFAKLGRAA